MSEKSPGSLVTLHPSFTKEEFDALAELALDMRSSWNHATDQVWRHLDPVLWSLTHNPLGRAANGGAG
jgi:starch phosphorylase